MAGRGHDHRAWGGTDTALYLHFVIVSIRLPICSSLAMFLPRGRCTMKPCDGGRESRHRSFSLTAPAAQSLLREPPQRISRVQSTRAGGVFVGS